MTFELKELKVRLYHALLKVDNKDLTENEVKIGYYLSRDHEIIKLLQETREALSKKG